MTLFLDCPMEADGRVAIPLALWESIGVQPGDTVVIETDGDSLLIRPFAVWQREASEP
jgi:antitoxin component of MazEF toxin-antitoxin module